MLRAGRLTRPSAVFPWCRNRRFRGTSRCAFATSPWSRSPRPDAVRYRLQARRESAAKAAIAAATGGKANVSQNGETTTITSKDGAQTMTVSAGGEPASLPGRFPPDVFCPRTTKVESALEMPGAIVTHVLANGGSVPRSRQRPTGAYRRRAEAVHGASAIRAGAHRDVGEGRTPRRSPSPMTFALGRAACRSATSWRCRSSNSPDLPSPARGERCCCGNG